MRKVIFQNMISLDGFFEGPNHELDWHLVDNEFNDYAIDTLDHIDTLLFGRVTYQLMASYWTTNEARTDDPMVASRMNSLSKIVFSKSLSKADWENTRLVKENAAEELIKLKKQQGKDLAIFGSSDLSLIFIQHNLIDEYRIFVNPVILGKGKRLFEGINDRFKLKLIKTKTFNSGLVLLYYQPA